MKIVHNLTKLFERRKDLRNDSTPEEILLWLQLKNSQLGFKFRRQHSIGGYIVDFYCPSKKLVVEIDGPSHSTKEGREYDEIRTKFFKGLDVKVIRFTNLEVATKTQDIIKKIKLELTTS
jgi:very-short-patch-repair endonuclease